MSIMPVTNDPLIDQLTGSLEPGRPLSVGHGRLAVLGAAAVTLAAAIAVIGIRPDLLAIQPAPLVAVTGGLFALLALAAGLAATRMVRPSVGLVQSGWRWALAAVLVLPVMAILQVIAFPSRAADMEPAAGLVCLGLGLVASVLTVIVLAQFLRRGAPVSISRASWLVGLTAGAVGALAVTIGCPDETLGHQGIWHAAIVLLPALATRLILPRLLRW